MASLLPQRGPCVLAWGDAEGGQLGLGDENTDSVVEPKIVTSLMEIKSLKITHISCGARHTVMLLDSGLVYSCGANEVGQLGRGGCLTRPERISALEAMFIKQVSCGHSHTLVLNDRGQVYAFGDNSKGQLGQNSLDEKFKRVPKIVKGFPSGTLITLIKSGGSHCLALSTDGHIFSWGNNANGQLGLGPGLTDISPSPRIISFIDGLPVAFLAAGASHCLALTLSGALTAWGKNSSGQLGLKDELDRSIPSAVMSLRSYFVTHVSCGNDHTVVLTKTGSVFTFGNGSAGQLGHGSFNDEAIPRQVLELMGSPVTQIACGREHTLALVSSSGKLYTFGSKGEVGSSTKSKLPIPTVLSKDWFSVNGYGIPKGNYHITYISSGGFQSFALVNNEDELPLDMRILQADDLHLFLDANKVEEIVQDFKSGAEAQTLKRHIDLVERIFASQSCLNGSFLSTHRLDTTDESSHMINMPAVRRSLKTLESVVSLSAAIRKSVENRLIPALSRNPPDEEALRVYLILPELPSFMDPNFVSGLTVAFGNSILTLAPSAQNMLVEWWKSLPATFFAKIVQIFQLCVKESLNKPFTTQYPSDEWFYRHATVTTCMLILRKLDQVNEEGGSIVPFTQFYIPEIQERIDIRADFVNWIQQPNVFAFCQYPFVFDTKAKSILLQTDVLLQMKSAVDEVQRVNLHNMFSGMLLNPVSPMLTLKIRRNNLKEDALRELMEVDPFELKKPLKVVFDGEEGVDAGGVKKEFFYLLLREIVHPKYGMFIEMEESRVLWFNQLSFEGPEMYLLIGVICGLAIYNSTIIDVNFPLVLYKKLLGRKTNLDDFREVQPNIARNLQYLLDYNDEDVEEVFGLTFQVSIPYYGTTQTIDLVPGGANVSVNAENRLQYVNAYVDYYLNSSIENQFAAFSEGFHRVCRGRVLHFFHPQELMEMVVGCQDYDFKELEEGAVYRGEYYRYHPVVMRFWDVFGEFTLDEKKTFLAFLTGSDKVPIHGMRSLQFTIQPVAGGENEDHLPVAHTCFNLLDLPRYGTKDIMRQKLKQAIEFSEGFGLA